jgi:hypothetical protein
VTQSDGFIDDAYQLLSGPPVSSDAAAATLSRSPGLYAWWAFPTVLPELPGLINDHDRRLRLMYVGRAANLRGRILKTHLRRSGSSELRRILAGLLMPTEGYRTMWKDGVVLIPEDELRLTSWMRRSLRLTWAEDPYPEEIEGDLVDRLQPALNIRGVDDTEIRAMVIDAKDRYDSSASAS